MSGASSPHSALDRARDFLGEIEQRPLDYAEGLVYDLVEQLESAQHGLAMRTAQADAAREQLEAAQDTLKWIVQFTEDTQRWGTVHTGFTHIQRRAVATLESGPARRSS